ncbi:hypothetical protein MAAFP003_5412 [Mycobacterium ahvazicum]|uniref:Uncharacterized protein n=1 Tax=Mycobacterium ahvazicum TaxID=1964395 RepID=A0A2K4YIU6_9MYCO|nr:DUF6065 family protein [Mycobacterium ahvazicum]SOX56704.1 hypothetical protein MAAFP003_5412 [Mycobacterium ahvazicum]
MSAQESGGSELAASDRELIAYELHSGHGIELIPAARDRGWMDSTHDRFANRCLPLLMANQAGWLVLNTARVRARWNGGPGQDSIEFDHGDSAPTFRPASHFGHGIITWSLPFLFRTPPGFNLLVRGPANCPKHGIAALEGLVETDWSPATFTLNWKFTRPRVWATFEADEPVGMLVPQRRGELDAFVPKTVSIAAAPDELRTAYHTWWQNRRAFNTDLQYRGSFARQAGWQKDYFRGKLPDGSAAAEHETRMRLRPFTRIEAEITGWPVPTLVTRPDPVR